MRRKGDKKKLKLDNFSPDWHFIGKSELFRYFFGNFTKDLYFVNQKFSKLGFYLNLIKEVNLFENSMCNSSTIKA